ncbi:hypothetical protein TIFTF001_028326 [Ficus carica]|uniref:Uncharacterized protein n=1 Tax=Ficus carica TaxID=3494 RepID=A0AA88DPP4_FICCA|nr:hypothetical protein TIFTF001_028326 [Ficus carica]
MTLSWRRLVNSGARVGEEYEIVTPTCFVQSRLRLSPCGFGCCIHHDFRLAIQPFSLSQELWASHLLSSRLAILRERPATATLRLQATVPSGNGARGVDAWRQRQRQDGDGDNDGNLYLTSTVMEASREYYGIY